MRYVSYNWLLSSATGELKDLKGCESETFAKVCAFKNLNAMLNNGTCSVYVWPAFRFRHVQNEKLFLLSFNNLVIPSRTKWILMNERKLLASGKKKRRKFSTYFQNCKEIDFKGKKCIKHLEIVQVSLSRYWDEFFNAFVMGALERWTSHISLLNDTHQVVIE